MAAILAVLVVVAAVLAAFVIVGNNKSSNSTVPDAPTGLTVTAGNAQVTLNWIAPTFYGGQAIGYYTVYQDGVSLTDHPTGLTDVITGLTNGQNYSFTVVAHNSVGNSTQSSSVSGIPCTVPNAPTGLTATPSNAQVILNWNAPAFNGGRVIIDYKLYHSTDSGSSYSVIASPSGLTCTDTGLNNGQTYWYEVSAVNAAGEGARTAPVSSTPTNTISQDTYWTGMIVPASEFSPNQSSGSYFIGHENGTSSDSMDVFAVSTSTVFASSTGGSFEIHDENGAMSISHSWPNLAEVQSSDLQAYMNRFQSVEVDVSSISIVLDGSTYGFGSTSTGDYAWVAPDQQMPTILNEVRLNATVIDQSTISTVGQKYTHSSIADIEVSKFGEAEQKLGFSFSGSTAELLLMSSMQNINTIQVSGDALDTITPSDVQRLSASYLSEGTEWLENLSSNIQEGFAVVSEQNNTISSSNLWFLLYPTDRFRSFDGICSFTVAPTDLTQLLAKTVNLDVSAFDLGSLPNLQVKIGIILNVTNGVYQHLDVKGLWQAVQQPHNCTQVLSVETDSYAIIVDAHSAIESLASAAGLDQQTAGMLSNITSFKDPAIALLVDDTVANMIEDDATAPWEYFAIAIIPDYLPTTSGLRYLDVKGVLYDSLIYFGGSGQNASGLPIVVADSVHDNTSSSQSTTIAGIWNSGRNGEYVGFDALATGMSLKDSSDLVGDIPGIGPALKATILALPFDLCIYNGMEIDDSQHNLVYSVPVIYLASGRGESHPVPATVHFTGVYVDAATELTNFDSMIADGLGTLDLPSASIQSLLSYLPSWLLPSTLQEAIDQASANLSAYQTYLLDQSLGHELPGYILAFNMSDVSVMPTLQVTEPVNGSLMSESNLTLSINASASSQASCFGPMSTSTSARSFSAISISAS